MIPLYDRQMLISLNDLLGCPEPADPLPDLVEPISVDVVDHDRLLVVGLSIRRLPLVNQHVHVWRRIPIRNVLAEVRQEAHRLASNLYGSQADRGKSDTLHTRAIVRVGGPI